MPLFQSRPSSPRPFDDALLMMTDTVLTVLAHDRTGQRGVKCVCVCVFVCVCACACVCVCVRVCDSACTLIFVCLCGYIYIFIVHMCVCVCVCLCTYACNSVRMSVQTHRHALVENIKRTEPRVNALVSRVMNMHARAHVYPELSLSNCVGVINFTL